MKSLVANPARLLMLVSLAVIGSAAAFAQTGPELVLNDGVGDVATITVNATGATCSGACSGLTVSGSQPSGQIIVQGTVGAVQVFGGVGGVLYEDGKELDVQMNLTSPNGGTFTVTASDNGFTAINPSYLFTPGIVSGGSALFQVYGGSSNNLLDESNLIATATSGGNNVTGSFQNTANPYSITTVSTYTFSPGGNSGVDLAFLLTPTQIAVSCPTASGQVGTPYSSSLNVTGGAPPYSFMLTGGTMLPPGLTLNPTTGAITGIPTQAGNFTFTAEVTDSEQDTATTVGTCPITIIPQPTPLTLACAGNSGEVGLPYSSELVASGGTGKGYEFSIVSGSLPPGLTLNMSTGAIAGTPTAEGTYPYVAQVTDSGGDTTTTTISGNNCAVKITTCGSKIGPITYCLPTPQQQCGTTKQIAWFNSHISLSGTIPTSAFSIYITNGQITYGSSTLNVPDAVITFSPAVTCSTTTFDTVNNRWLTTVPLSYATKADEVFAQGLAYLLPSNANGGNITWSADVTSSVPNVDVTWAVGASDWFASNKGTNFPGWNASTSTFTPNYLALDVMPAHNAPICNTSYTSGDQAGAPEFSGRANLLEQQNSGQCVQPNWTGTFSSSYCNKTPVCTPNKPPVTIQCPPSTGIVGQPYKAGFTATGGETPYTFSIASGSISPLTLNSSTGELTGTVTSPVTLTFVGKVTDSSSPEQTATTGANACTITFSNEPNCSWGKTSPILNCLHTAHPSNFSVLCGQNGGLNVSGGNFDGNIGVPNAGTLQVASATTIGGTLIPGSQVQTQIEGQNNGIASGANTDAFLAQAVSDSLTASSNLSGLGATQSVQSQFPSSGIVLGNLTVNLVNGTQNVINLGSDFALLGNLTFNGSAGTSLVVNVPGNFAMLAGTVNVSGGMGPMDIIWNVYGSKSTVQGLPFASGCGVILAPQCGSSNFNCGSYTGSLICGKGGQTTVKCGGKWTNPCAPQQNNTLNVQCPSNVSPVYNAKSNSNPYSSAVTVTGGTAPYTFAVTSGALGDGLTLNTNTGVISGNLNSSTPLNFSITVTDSKGNTGTTPGACYIAPIW